MSMNLKHKINADALIWGLTEANHQYKDKARKFKFKGTLQPSIRAITQRKIKEHKEI